MDLPDGQLIRDGCDMPGEHGLRASSCLVWSHAPNWVNTDLFRQAAR